MSARKTGAVMDEEDDRAGLLAAGILAAAALVTAATILRARR
jgi:hypothetical protein